MRKRLLEHAARSCLGASAGLEDQIVDLIDEPGTSILRERQHWLCTNITVIFSSASGLEEVQEALRLSACSVCLSADWDNVEHC